MGDAYNPFEYTGSHIDEVSTDASMEDKTRKGKAETTQNKNTATQNISDIEQAGYDTTGDSLNHTGHQRSNYATTGGQWGRINNRDFSKTLRLAREVDAYNAKPQGHIMRIARNGVQDLGTGFDKPKLETMETRAMDQAFQLDTNQKQLSQQLQAAINAKDLELFKQAYMQKFQVNLTDLQAQNLLTSYVRQQEIMQIVTKDRAYFQRAFGTDTAVAVQNLVMQYPSFANILGTMFGLTPNSRDELTMEQFETMTYNELRNQGVDPVEARQKSILLRERLELSMEQQSAYNVKNADKMSSKHSDKKKAKETNKQAKSRS